MSTIKEEEEEKKIYIVTYSGRYHTLRKQKTERKISITVQNLKQQKMQFEK